MRLPGYIFVELTVAATLAAGTTAGAVWGIHRLRADSRTPPPPTEPATALEPREDLSTLPDLRVALESSGTFMGMSDELLLARVRTQPIVRFKLNHGGSSLSFRVDFADGSRAAWKPNQTNTQTIPRKEVAAYRLNRLLGLNSVPPAATRAVSREDLFTHLHPESLEFLPRIQAETVFGANGKTIGTASYWIPVIKDSGLDTAEGRQLGQSWLTQGETIPPDRVSMAAQLSELIVFDFLTANPDRYSGGNMKMSADGTQLYFMDNTMTFFLDPTGIPRNREALLRAQRFSRALYEALPRITVRTLQRALTEEVGASYEILTSSEIEAVVARRQFARKYIDDLIAQYGEGKVLAFP